MTVNYESEKLVLRLWYMTHRTCDWLGRCEDQVFGEYGLTTEHYAVLSTIKYLDEPVRITDIARWLERSTNSVSMIVDRMVKAGLLKRIRDRRDRREVHVTITSKGETALKPAVLAGWEFIGKILSPLSSEDRRTLLSLLETLKYRAFEYLNPGVDIEEMRRNEITGQANLVERLVQYALPSTPRAKRQGSRKGRTIR
jgi:DNA-binding MarR family transcriptional regulator